MPTAAKLSGLRNEVQRFGIERRERERVLSEFAGRSTSLHPAGFAAFDAKIITAIPKELGERLLAAIASTIGAASYPARRERISRLHAELSVPTSIAHTLGGCHFIRWRELFLVTRELARAAKPAKLSPGECLLWDRRFEVVYASDGHSPLTVGYLGTAGAAALKRLLPKHNRNHLPRLLFPFLPALWDELGLAAVPHLHYRRDGLTVVPLLTFQPASPLTQAGFAVV
jgi:hypothetical protein